MMRISLRCPSCNAGIKAPVQLIGRTRNCPGCQHSFIVRPRPPEESGPVLVDEQNSPLFTPLPVAASV